MDSTLSLPKMLLPLPSSKSAAAASQSAHLGLPPSCPAAYKSLCFACFDRGAHSSAAAVSFSFARNLLRCSPAAPPSGRFASLSCSPALSGSGGGGDGLAGVGGSGGSGGDGGSSGSEAAAKPLAGETEDASAPGFDVIVLRVGGMSCGGCAASVKRILESQPQVASATVSFEKSTAFIWVVPEVKVEQEWKQQLGEKLAKHLTTCGFQSDIQGDYAIEGENKS